MLQLWVLRIPQANTPSPQIWGDFYLFEVARRGDAAARGALGGAEPPSFFPAFSSHFNSMNLSDNTGKERAKACVWLLSCQIHFNW